MLAATFSGAVHLKVPICRFDDSNTINTPGWFGDRVISQRCGHTLLDTANEVTKGGYWGPSHQIPYMQLVTWNDYEEGTETESGVDNCYWTVTLTLPQNSTTMSRTLSTQNDPNNEATTDPGHNYYDSIHHYVVWTAPPGGTNLSKGAQLAANATQYDLTKLGLKSGTSVDVYLEMIGQPSMQNEMSNNVTYTQK